MQKRSPYRQFRYQVEIDGRTQGGFNECSLLDSTTDPVEYSEGNETPGFRKLADLKKYGSITLKRGIAASTDLYVWRQQIIHSGAGIARKNISIILIDEGGEEIARWDIVLAWPTKCAASSFDAKDNEVAIETLEIAHEGFKRVS